MSIACAWEGRQTVVYCVVLAEPRVIVAPPCRGP